MIISRAGFALPAVLVLAAAVAVAVVPSASAVVPGYTPVDPDAPVVVAELGDSELYGIGVSERAITWGSTDGAKVVEPDVAVPLESPTVGVSRAYQPDLGKSALTLADPVTPPIAHALNQASTPEWSVGFDPFTPGMATGYAMTVRHEGGAEFVIPMHLGVSPMDGDVWLWGDTAVLGQNVVNLNTREVFAFSDLCEAPRPVLADGVLLLRDSCEGAVVAVEVPADGITADVLDGPWTTVLDELPDVMAYSQGLLVFGSDVEGSSEIGYRRLDGRSETWRRTVDGSVVAVRAQGHRFVVVTTDSDAPVATGSVFEEGRSPDSEPLAQVTVDGAWKRSVMAPDVTAGDVAASVVAPTDPSADMSLDTAAIDLYGRTLAWSDGGQILAATLPPLAGGAVTSTAPAAGKAGAPVAVTAAGLLPGEEVAVWLESDPVLLTLGRAAADGTFSATVTLPSGVAAGGHTLTVHGVESGWSSVRSITLAAAGNPGLRIDTGR